MIDGPEKQRGPHGERFGHRNGRRAVLERRVRHERPVARAWKRIVANGSRPGGR